MDETWVTGVFEVVDVEYRISELANLKWRILNSDIIFEIKHLENPSSTSFIEIGAISGILNLEILTFFSKPAESKTPIYKVLSKSMDQLKNKN